jgi:hypothetical protein
MVLVVPGAVAKAALVHPDVFHGVVPAHPTISYMIDGLR